MLLRCCCLCSRNLRQTILEGGELFSARTGHQAALECFDDPADLYRYLGRHPDWDAAVIAYPGALGMEAATRVREDYAHAPLVWCSDDRFFAMHSYRLHCAMFLQLPVMADQVAEALARCVEQVSRENEQVC